ncbi:MAG: class I SAM-dependent methyltransferase [Caldilineaceae bacterium]
MTQTLPFSFPRYLAAKKSVDDRALNRLVWQRLADEVAAQTSGGQPLDVLEIGAGIGTMAERVMAWGLLEQARYTALDNEAENVAAIRARLGTGRGAGLDLAVEQADVFDFARRPHNQARYDLLIAHAVLDLFDVPAALPRLLRMVKPDGLCYFTINFDGATIFEPVIDAGLDAQIEALYHRSMDERITDGQPSGDSRTGRHLFHLLPAAGVEILAAGSSDWVVFGSAGEYPQDEAYFLHCILHFIESTLRGHPELDPEIFTDWLSTRRQQIGSGELVYIAHQTDFVGRICQNDD